MKKRSIILLITSVIIVIIVALSAAAMITSSKNEDTLNAPRDVLDLVVDYMSSYEDGNKSAVDLMHFESDFIREAYIAADDALIDYKVESIEKINDDLYQFTIMIKTKQTLWYSGDYYERVFNFVARIENEWRFINGVSNIPEALTENLDKSKYVYEEDNIIAPEDIVQTIDISR